MRGDIRGPYTIRAAQEQPAGGANCPCSSRQDPSLLQVPFAQGAAGEQATLQKPAVQSEHAKHVTPSPQ